MTSSEANYFIIHARSALESHQKKLRQSHRATNSLAAIDAILEDLQEIAREHPGKIDKIDTLRGRYRPR